MYSATTTSGWRVVSLRNGKNEFPSRSGSENSVPPWGGNYDFTASLRSVLVLCTVQSTPRSAVTAPSAWTRFVMRTRGP